MSDVSWEVKHYSDDFILKIYGESQSNVTIDVCDDDDKTLLPRHTIEIPPAVILELIRRVKFNLERDSENPLPPEEES